VFAGPLMQGAPEAAGARRRRLPMIGSVVV